MELDIPTPEDREQHRVETVLQQWVKPINHAIMNGEWLEDGYRYLHVRTDNAWIEENRFEELKKVYLEKGWVIEQHSMELSVMSTEWHIRVYKAL